MGTVHPLAAPPRCLGIGGTPIAPAMWRRSRRRSGPASDRAGPERTSLPWVARPDHPAGVGADPGPAGQHAEVESPDGQRRHRRLRSEHHSNGSTSSPSYRAWTARSLHSTVQSLRIDRSPSRTQKGVPLAEHLHRHRGNGQQDFRVGRSTCPSSTRPHPFHRQILIQSGGAGSCDLLRIGSVIRASRRLRMTGAPGDEG